MRQTLFCSIFFLLRAATTTMAQGNIMLVPLLGTKEEEIIIYNNKTEESAQWFFDNGGKKMMKWKGGFKTMNTGFEAGSTRMQSYISGDHSRILLTWNTSTAQSVSWYYESRTKKLEKSPLGYQLPQKIGLSGSVMMFPYLDKENTEIILCWETATGKSISFYYNKSAKMFMRSTLEYQLPEDPGISGKIMMHPYLAGDGNETILIWDMNTGKSIAFKFSSEMKKYLVSLEKNQLPANPGVSEEVMMYPYIGKYGKENILAWSCKNGKSAMWNYDFTEEQFTQAPSGYQLPVSFTENVMMIPRVGNGDEIIYVWDSTNGQSVNYLFDRDQNKYVKSANEYQLPPNPFE